MNIMKKNIYLLVAFVLILLFSPKVKPQAIEVKKEGEKKRSFLFFKRDELSEKHKIEMAELREKQEKERTAERERLKQEKEKEELERAKVKEKEEQEDKLEKESRDIKLENKYTAYKQIKERKKEIRKTKKKKKFIEIITNEEDPVFIEDAYIKESKTKFLKLKDVELKYKVKLVNQTPKIINSALIVWERKIPFTESQTIERETKVSKPFIPYEKRTIEYNDLNSKREGETYRVKIIKVAFEDGTQWKNPNTR